MFVDHIDDHIQVKHGELILFLLVWSRPAQSYGVDHLLTFANLKHLGVLVEQQAGETLTVMESKVGKLVNDKTAGKLGAKLKNPTMLYRPPLIK